MINRQVSSSGTELLAVGSRGHMALYNTCDGRRLWWGTGHTEDVNSVCWLDDSSQVFVSGGDDSLLQVWDRRMLQTAGSCAGCPSANAAKMVIKRSLPTWSRPPGCIGPALWSLLPHSHALMLCA